MQDSRFSRKVAGRSLAEVEDLVPGIAPVLVPIFGPSVILGYPTKPISVAVQVLTVSICTYVKGVPPMRYENAARDPLSSEVPQAFTTNKPSNN